MGTRRRGRLLHPEHNVPGNIWSLAPLADFPSAMFHTLHDKSLRALDKTAVCDETTSDIFWKKWYKDGKPLEQDP